MAVYLSPGVFPVEIDLSAIPTAVGPLLPAFIGTSTKGPMNTPTYITNAQQYIDQFGTPTPVSYLGYAVLAYMADGNACYVMRVGVECQVGQPVALDDICIDTSGTCIQGWGRIPLFTGIDYGHIDLRNIGDGVSTDSLPVTFTAANVTNIEFSDANAGGSYGPTLATLVVTGATAYNGAVNDSVVLLITSPPTAFEGNPGGDPLDGATYQAIRNSDGAIIATGTLTNAGSWSGTYPATSTAISLGNDVSVAVKVLDDSGDPGYSGMLDTNDTFIFDLVPNTESFSIAVQDSIAFSSSPGCWDPNPELITMSPNTYTTVSALVNALNAAIGDSQKYEFVESLLADGVTTVPQARTKVAGRGIQLMGSQGWALLLGTQQYAWDIPRAYLFGLEGGPYSIVSANNQANLQIIGNGVTKTIQMNLAPSIDISAQGLAAQIDSTSWHNGQKWFDCFALTIPDQSVHIFIAASNVSVAAGQDNSLSVLNLLSNYSNLKTLQFADTLGIQYPFQSNYRGYYDNRVSLPASSETNPAEPASAVANPSSAQALSDDAYYAGIVGWIVATSPGSWLNSWSLSLSAATQVPGNSAGLYNISITDNNGVIQDAIQAVNFDKTSPQYIGNYINPGTTKGGHNGNSFINWEPRPSYLNFDQTQPAYYEVRNPSPLYRAPFIGMADGIPTDPAYSNQLDSAVIGNPAELTGIYGFQNPDTYDINLLLTPGFSSGAVIAQALQMCETRGDVLYLVDPPFGLRPQQVVDWHNGMLTSDLTAAINSSYGALYWGWLQIYDQFNNIYVWVPPSGSIAGVFSYTATVAEQWFAPAGLNRGVITLALNVEYSPSQGERDLLYGSGNAVNPIVNFPKYGITVWGQRTLQREQTARDRVNVRMLLIYIKKNMIQLLKTFIFEPNDVTLWAQVVAACNPFLSDIMARRGLTGFNIVCDASNNTPERIDDNELWVSVFLKPTRAVEFIVLNLVIMQTGASFSAENVLAAGGIVTTSASGVTA